MEASIEFIGCDVGKSTVTYYIGRSSLTREVPNSGEGVSMLLDDLAPHSLSPQRYCCVMEHCGHYGHQWAGLLVKSGIGVSMEKTTVLRHVSGEHHRKDDGYDARKLYEYARRFCDALSGYAPVSPQQEDLRQIYRIYRQLTGTATSLQQLRKACSCPAAVQEITRELEHLKTRQRQLINTALAMIKANEQLHDYYKILLSAPGMGPITSWYWLTRFPIGKPLNGRQTASWLGTAPHPRQSGNRRSPDRSTGHGDRELRRLMHLCARSQATHNPLRKAYYQRLVQQGKPKRLVLNNIINRQINLLCQLWNKAEYYDPNYQQKQQLYYLTKS